MTTVKSAYFVSKFELIAPGMMRYSSSWSALMMVRCDNTKCYILRKAKQKLQKLQQLPHDSLRSAKRDDIVAQARLLASDLPTRLDAEVPLTADDQARLAMIMEFTETDAMTRLSPRSPSQASQVRPINRAGADYSDCSDDGIGSEGDDDDDASDTAVESDHKYDGVHKSGFMWSQGQQIRSKWNQRWFQLTGTHLVYYTSTAKGSRPRGVIPLCGCEILSSHEKNRPYCLELLLNPEHQHQHRYVCPYISMMYFVPGATCVCVCVHACVNITALFNCTVT